MKKETKGAGFPAPKGDTTQALRIYRRRARLNQIAWQAGYSNWSAYETAVLNGKTRLTPLALDGATRAEK